MISVWQQEGFVMPEKLREMLDRIAKRRNTSVVTYWNEPGGEELDHIKRHGVVGLGSTLLYWQEYAGALGGWEVYVQCTHNKLDVVEDWIETRVWGTQRREAKAQ